MNLAEYYDVERVLDGEAQALARWCATHGRFGPAGAGQPTLSSVTVTATTTTSTDGAASSATVTAEVGRLAVSST
jgi:hypothetical protein